jgi:hypothetical protein
VFAVVQHEQETAGTDQLFQSLDERLPALLWDTQDSGCRLGYQCWISDRSQLDEPDTVRVIGDESTGELECESRLADAAWPASVSRRARNSAGGSSSCTGVPTI